MLKTKLNQFRIALLALACCLATAAGAAEPLPKHIVLVYADARPAYSGLDPDGYRRLAAFVDPQGRPVETLFDGFLILGLRAQSGGGLVPDFGQPIQPPDFDWFLDHVFGPGQQVPNLEAAINSLPPALRTTRQIILAIPYPLATDSPAARLAQVDDFCAKAVQRFAQGHFAHLQLNGFYWVQETVLGPDGALATHVAQAVHARHLNLFWIPYYDADGEANWRACGFDCAMLQPNYAFRDVPPTRFAAEDAKRRHLGMSVEMEIARYTRNRPESPAWKDSFLKYLAAGRQNHWADLDCVSYYFGNDFVKMSEDPAEYPYYELVHKFIDRSLEPGDLDRLAADAQTELNAARKTGTSKK